METLSRTDGPQKLKGHSYQALTPAVQKEAPYEAVIAITPVAKSPPLPAQAESSGTGTRVRSLSEELEARVLRSSSPTPSTSVTTVELSPPPLKTAPAAVSTPKTSFIESPVSVTGSGSSTEDSPPDTSKEINPPLFEKTPIRIKEQSSEITVDNSSSDIADSSDPLPVEETAAPTSNRAETVDDALCSLLTRTLQQEDQFLAAFVEASPQSRKVRVELSSGCVEDLAAIERDVVVAVKKSDMASANCASIRNMHTFSVSKGQIEAECLELLGNEVSAALRLVSGGSVVEALEGVHLLQLQIEEFQEEVGYVDRENDDMTTY